LINQLPYSVKKQNFFERFIEGLKIDTLQEVKTKPQTVVNVDLEW